jgi:hypothetical protein
LSAHLRRINLRRTNADSRGGQNHSNTPSFFPPGKVIFAQDKIIFQIVIDFQAGIKHFLSMVVSSDVMTRIGRAGRANARPVFFLTTGIFNRNISP